MLSKESKIRVLENFYALDYVFFGKPIQEVEMCCPLLKEEYLSIKGALSSVYIEMMKLIDHTPAVVEEQVDGTALKINAMDSAIVARENAELIVKSDKAKANIKKSLKEEIKENSDVNVSELVEGQVRRKAFSLAVDNLLIAKSISESEKSEKLNDWEGRIIEDSYKILRDNLIEAAHQILYDETDDVVTESEKQSRRLTEAPIKYDADQIIGSAEAHGHSIEKKEKAGCEKWSVKTPFKSAEYKKKMMACKAKASIKGLNAMAKYIKQSSKNCKDEDCVKQLKDKLKWIVDEIKDNQRYLK
jgi:hypothetical protein